MNEPIYRLHTLPESFFSEETGRPFATCFDCGKRLADCEDGYLIQKAFSKGETIMELAICSPCHETLQQSYSKESRERIWNFYLDHGDLAGRLKKFHPIPVGNPDFWTNHCLTCGATRLSQSEYMVAAQVLDGDLVYGELPLMICFSCMEQIIDLLSERSRDTYDRWLDRILPMAPETASPGPRLRVFF